MRVPGLCKIPDYLVLTKNEGPDWKKLFRNPEIVICSEQWDVGVYGKFD